MALPRGRPPYGATVVDGAWVLSDQALERAANRLETHREACRERYRRTRDALQVQRPDLFRMRNGKRRRVNTTLRESQLPFCSNILQGIEEEGDTGATEGR